MFKKYIVFGRAYYGKAEQVIKEVGRLCKKFILLFETVCLINNSYEESLCLEETVITRLRMM